MNKTLLIIAALLVGFGSLWILQGTGVLAFGPMANKMGYAYLGIATALAGLGVACVALWRRQR